MHDLNIIIFRNLEEYVNYTEEQKTLLKKTAHLTHLRMSLL